MLGVIFVFLSLVLGFVLEFTFVMQRLVNVKVKILTNLMIELWRLNECFLKWKLQSMVIQLS